MGVVNVTPDSFSDGGAWFTPEAAVAHGRELVAQGADLLDVGGESTRPGAERPSTAEELRRVLPVVEALSTAGAGVGRHDARRGGRRGAGCRRRARQRRQRRAGRPRDGAPWSRSGRCRSSPCTGAGTAATCRPGRSTTTSSPTSCASCAERVEALAAAGVQPEPSCSTPVSGSPRTPSTTGSCCAGSTRSWRWATASSSARPARPSWAPVGRTADDGSAAAGARRRHRGHHRARRPPRRLVRAGARRRRDGRRARRRRGAARLRGRSGERRVPRPHPAVRCAWPGVPRGLRARAPRGAGVRRRRRARRRPRPAGASDDLADTVNYGEIGAAALARIEGEPHDLIERLAELVAAGRPRAQPRSTRSRSRCTSRRRRSACRSATSTVSVTRAARSRCRSSSRSGRTCRAANSDPHDIGTGPPSTRSRTTRRSRVVAVVGAVRHRPGRRPRAADLRQRRRGRPAPRSRRRRCCASCTASRRRSTAAARCGGARAPSTSTSCSTATRHPAPTSPPTGPRLTLPHPRAHERAFVLRAVARGRPRRRAAPRGPGGAGRRPRREHSTRPACARTPTPDRPDQPDHRRRGDEN